MDRIPSVDLRDFLSNDPERKQKFIREIGDSQLGLSHAHYSIALANLRKHNNDVPVGLPIGAHQKGIIHRDLEIRRRGDGIISTTSHR